MPFMRTHLALFGLLSACMGDVGALPPAGTGGGSVAGGGVGGAGGSAALGGGSAATGGGGTSSTGGGTSIATGGGTGGGTAVEMPDAGTPPVDLSRFLPDASFIDWSNAGVVKPDGTHGIPAAAAATDRCASLTSSATVDQINAAISGCANKGALESVNKEVYLAAGTYQLSDYIDIESNNVTLRGAGPGMTILNFNGGWANGGIHMGGGILLSFNSPDPTHIRDWTDGYAQGSTTLTVSSTMDIDVGDVLMLDQLNDDAVSGTTPPFSAIDVSENYTANGGTEVSRSMGTRAQQQYTKVTRVVDATHLAIFPGVYMPNWRSSQSPQIYYFNDWNQMIGAEDMTIVNVGGAQSNVQQYNCYNCWLKNIESSNSNNAHLITIQTARLEIRDSYFHDTMVGGGDSRGLFMGVGSDYLVENNMFEKLPLPISIWGPQGSVIAYNFTTDSAFVPYPDIMIPGITTEAGYTSLCLFEGNYTTGVQLDNNHGAGGLNAFFRNRIVGWEQNKTSANLPITINYLNHYTNLVGNVLGEPGYHDNYEVSTTNPQHTDSSIYELGFWIYSVATDRIDDRVASTMFRSQNWDSVSAAIVNPLAAGALLPTSMYLKAKPAWWGDGAWPPFDATHPATSAADLKTEYLALPAGARWHAMFPSKVPTTTPN